MMSQTPPPTPRIAGFSDDEIDRYLVGASSPEETARFAEHLRRVPEDAQWIAAARQFRLATTPDFQNDIATGRARALLAGRLGAFPGAPTPVVHVQSTQTNSSIPRVRSVSAPWRAPVTWAATAIMALLAVAGVWQHGRGAQDQPSYATYHTTNAQILRVTLPDGSRLTLAPNSTLGVSRDFTHRRELTLTGRLLLDVVHTDGAPFLVHTGAVATRVLGTTFDVTRYPADRETRVVVLTGKVAVGGQRTVTVAAGSMGRATDSTAMVGPAADAAAYTSWTSGTLTFRNAAIADMLEAVGRWYGVEFRLADSALAQQAVTATFSGESRADALALIRTVLNVTMTFDETSRGTTIVTLRAKPRLSRGPTTVRRSRRDTLFNQNMEVGR